MTVRRMVSRILWRRCRHFLLDVKGFRNSTIHDDDRFLDLFMDVYGKGKALLGIRELQNIYCLVQAVEHVYGDIAEVGVYKGGSARIICEVKGKKDLHLFDTFEGMPPVNRTVDLHKEGEFADTSLENVKEYLAGFPGVYFHKGLFPGTAARITESGIRFSFVNLDVDIYQSTLDGLKLFYPILSGGGILISHDYRNRKCPGVKRAFDEFLSDKRETLVPLWDSQCLFIKKDGSS